ncbi:MAG: glycosyltransferase [Planctomycetota bacterium]
MATIEHCLETRISQRQELGFVSVVVPVYNEEANIEELVRRIRSALEARVGRFEIVLVDDGSRDRSLELMHRLADRYGEIVAVELQRNFGQHAAILAGLEHCRGDVVVTLDADLQNPPEEIPKLLDKVAEGYDVVGGWRALRQDSRVRLLASRLINRVTSRMVGVDMRDYGCMLRAYTRPIVDRLREGHERSTFIPALATLFTKKVIEIPVAHDARTDGPSRYSLGRLIRLQFDLVTAFSPSPLKLISLAGALIAVLGLVFAVFLAIRRLVVGPEVEGVFTLFGILFFFIGVQLLAIGILGEYVARIYIQVLNRPRFLVRAVHRRQDER